jgi:hypothetical protein
MMDRIKLSKNEITSFCGDVVTLSLSGATSSVIKWELSDIDSASLRELRDRKSGVNNMVLITLIKVGSFYITAKTDAGVHKCKIDCRERAIASEGDIMKYYFADLHSHTTPDHNSDTFKTREKGLPSDCLEAVRKEGILDCFVLSDHASLSDDTDFFRVMEMSEKYTDESFIVFGGMESEVTLIEKDRYGISHKNSGETVTFNADNFADVKNWNDYFKKMSSNSLAIGTFAHPQVLGWDENGLWNFNLKAHTTDKMKNFFKLTEMGNGGTRGTNMLHEYAYSVALDCGYKVSPICTSDSHGPEWGYAVMPGQTVIMAPAKSKELFIDAILNNRVYATENGNVKLYYTVNGAACGKTIPIAEEYKFHVEIGKLLPGEEFIINKIEVISDYGKCVFNKIIDIENRLDFTVKSKTASYFYLRLCDDKGNRTWSSPVWTGREADMIWPDVKLISVNDVIKSAVDLKTGLLAEKLVNGDMNDTWEGFGNSAEIKLELEDTFEISGVGLYPYIFRIEDCLKDKSRNTGTSTAHFAASLAKQYEIYMAGEDEEYIKVADGFIRIFGEEEMVRFSKVQAKYVKVSFLNTVGSSYEKKGFENENIKLGGINIYK